jgi:hypothetical protein
MSPSPMLFAIACQVLDPASVRLSVLALGARVLLPCQQVGMRGNRHDDGMEATGRFIPRVVVSNEDQQLGENDRRLSGASRRVIRKLDAVRRSLEGTEGDRNGFWLKLEVTISCRVHFDESASTRQKPHCLHAYCDVVPIGGVVEIDC